MTQARRGSRIGILGGTLDPIHVGHIETALAAQRALRLASVVVMPSRVPPHRQQEPSASAFHRFAMAALAVNGLSGISVSDEELSAEAPSYTASTLQRWRERGIDRSEIFFITGADAFAEIETWYRYPEVLNLAHFVVISRPGASLETLAARIPELKERLRDVDGAIETPATPSVFLVHARTPDVSSTEIRRRLRTGEAVDGLLPEPVAAHIRQHRLYVEP
jgi:nicotinate-nucleotide adenylyltransferase